MEEHSRPLFKHWLFADVPEAELSPLLSWATEVRFVSGDVLFREGEAADGLYLITAGSVRVAAAEEGRGTVFATVGADDVVGEMGVLDAEPRSATATALGLCSTYFLPAEPFLDALERSPSLCVRLLALVTMRLRRVDRRLAEMPLSDAPSRSTELGAMPASARLHTEERDLPRLGSWEALSRVDVHPEDSRFYRWLVERSHRPDSLGDVARLARDDTAWPRGTEDIDTLVRHLDTVRADDHLHVALRRAWRSWIVSERRGQPSGGFVDFD